MLNNVTLIGHLGADPEMRNTQDGRLIGNFRMATSERWTDKESKQQKERTEWHSVVVFSEGLAKVVGQYLKKGSKVYVGGKLQTRKWTDKNDIERYTTEVVLNGFDAKLVMLDGAGSNKPPAADSPDQYGKTSARSGSSDPQAPLETGDPGPGSGGSFPADRDMDDEIPFNRKLHPHENMPWMP